jgi:hypothetical protein
LARDAQPPPPAAPFCKPWAEGVADRLRNLAKAIELGELAPIRHVDDRTRTGRRVVLEFGDAPR